VLCVEERLGRRLHSGDFAKDDFHLRLLGPGTKALAARRAAPDPQGVLHDPVWSQRPSRPARGPRWGSSRYRDG
jgi:hypothetical protein